MAICHAFPFHQSVQTSIQTNRNHNENNGSEGAKGTGWKVTGVVFPPKTKGNQGKTKENSSLGNVSITICYSMNRGLLDLFFFSTSSSSVSFVIRSLIFLLKLLYVFWRCFILNLTFFDNAIFNLHFVRICFHHLFYIYLEQLRF